MLNDFEFVQVQMRCLVFLFLFQFWLPFVHKNRTTCAFLNKDLSEIILNLGQQFGGVIILLSI